MEAALVQIATSIVRSDGACASKLDEGCKVLGEAGKQLQKALCDSVATFAITALLDATHEAFWGSAISWRCGEHASLPLRFALLQVHVHSHS